MRQHPLTPGGIALVASLVFFVLSYLALGSFEKFLARRELSIQAATMLQGFREGYESARTNLMKLPSLEGLHCQNEISGELSRQEFDNQYVRWFGVARRGQIICRGQRVGVDLSDSKSHVIDDTWSLVSAKSPGITDNLMVAQRRGDTQYLAMLEPLLFNFQDSVDCNGCVSYHFMVKAHPEVEMESLPTPTPPVISYEAGDMRLGAEMKLTLNATQQYVNTFSIPGRFISAAIAAAFAGLVGFAMFAYLTRRTSIAFLIKEGIKRNEFLPYYQPIIDSRDGRVLGAEALVRWRTKRGALIPPGQFIPFAEENHFIEPITDQMLEKVLVDLGRLGWQNSDRFISINAGAEQITDSPFCKKLIARIADKNIPARNLSVEITERHQISDLDRGRTALQCLDDAGIEVKLDDTGAGFGGFAYIQELPIKTLKIDKMFIDPFRSESDDPKREVLRAIVEFARITSLKTIAEGVETEDQVSRLGEAGVYAIQGFVYARPMPVEEFVRWAETHQNDSSTRNA